MSELAKVMVVSGRRRKSEEHRKADGGQRSRPAATSKSYLEISKRPDSLDVGSQRILPNDGGEGESTVLGGFLKGIECDSVAAWTPSLAPTICIDNNADLHYLIAMNGKCLI
ncbi:MAG: hypothetical protein E5W70_05550 [Mesorhizobium sp.]|nr:MAG: hypothetical protein E5W70_05550 [Mesorhizobium sp.]